MPTQYSQILLANEVLHVCYEVLNAQVFTVLRVPVHQNNKFFRS